MYVWIFLKKNSIYVHMTLFSETHSFTLMLVAPLADISLKTSIYKQEPTNCKYINGQFFPNLMIYISHDVLFALPCC